MRLGILEHFVKQIGWRVLGNFLQEFPELFRGFGIGWVILVRIICIQSVGSYSYRSIRAGQPVGDDVFGNMAEE